MSDPHLSDRRPPAEPASIEPAPIELVAEPIALGEPDAGSDGPGTDGPAERSTDDGHGARSSRRRLILLGALLALAVAGVGVFGTVGWRIYQQSDATLITPPEVAGLTRDDSERARTTADYLRTGFAADINTEESIGAVYADPAAPQRSVLLFGGTGLIWQPERDLDRLFALVSDGEGAITGLREVDPGSLGGVMKCGALSGQGEDMAVCGWADHGSVLMGMFPGRSLDDAGKLLQDIRTSIQQRG